MKKIIIMGATSGLGRGLAEKFIEAGWHVGAAGRNREALRALERLAPVQVSTSEIDILSPDAPQKLLNLIEECGGMDCYLHCSGIALLDKDFDTYNEIRICETNTVGFTRMCESAFRYFAETKSPGRLAAITSVAGVRGLELMPAYSASKAYDSHLLEALRQRAAGGKLPLRIIDIKPGWTKTPLLDAEKHYMFEMDADKAVDLIFKAVLHAKRSAVIGLRWKIITSIQKLVPASLWAKIHIPLWH